MFGWAAAFNQPLPFDTAAVTNVREYIMCWGPTDEKRDSDIVSYPTCFQMFGLFQYATAFNQPLSLNTSNVDNVRLYLCCPTCQES